MKGNEKGYKNKELSADELLMADGDLTKEQIEGLKSLIVFTDDILAPIDFNTRPCSTPLSEEVPAIDPNAIRACLFRYTYIWLRNGQQFWFYPTYVGRNSIAGWRWRQHAGWTYFGMALRQIQSFQCY